MLHLVLIATLYKPPRKSTKQRRVSLVGNKSEQMEHATEVIQTTTGSNIPDQEPKNGVVHTLSSSVSYNRLNSVVLNDTRFNLFLSVCTTPFLGS
jgi:hypothetical protein